MSTHNSGSTSAVTVAATPTLIKSHDVEPRIATVMMNLAAATIYYGFDANIAADTAFPLESNGKVSISRYHGAVYAITASSTAEVRVMTY